MLRLRQHDNQKALHQDNPLALRLVQKSKSTKSYDLEIQWDKKDIVHTDDVRLVEQGGGGNPRLSWGHKLPSPGGVLFISSDINKDKYLQRGSADFFQLPV